MRDFLRRLFGVHRRRRELATSSAPTDEQHVQLREDVRKLQEDQRARLLMLEWETQVKGKGRFDDPSSQRD